MSDSRARALLKSTRWYYLGFCFLWATTFAGLSSYGGQMAAALPTYGPLQQVAEIVGVMIAAILFLRGVKSTASLAWISAVLLAVGSSLFYASPFATGSAEIIGLAGGAIVGFASGLFFVQWQEFYASEGSSRTALYIPVSAAFSVVLCYIVSILPLPVSAVLNAVVFPALTGLSLVLSLRNREPHELHAFKKPVVTKALLDLWRPVFCVSVLGFVWKLVTGLFSNDANSTFFTVMAGFGLAVLLVVVIELFTRNGFEILRIYQVLFPVVAGVFLLPTLFGPSFAPFLNAILMFGFEVANLLLLITCAVYAGERGVSAAGIYAIGVCPVLVSMLAGNLLGLYLTSQETYSFTVAVDVLFVCIYALSLVLVLVSWARHGRSSDAANSTGSSSTRVTEQAAVLFDGRGGMRGFDSQVEPLSKREQEVVEMVVAGNNVPAIARKLFISENTVRGHLKSVYRKLGVHSKQEIIDGVGR